MAGRQFKQGLDYFPFDTGFFDHKKIQLIEAEFGIKGIIIIMRLLCKIYENGYFYQWGGDECLLFSRAAGAEFVPGAVNEIVDGLVRRRFFDKGCFDSFGILTSESIQKIYLEVCDRRKCLNIIPQYWLLDIPSQNNVNIISINVDINRQRKGKGKGKKRKKEQPSVADPDFFTMDGKIQDDNSEKLEYESLVNYFNEHTKGVFGTVRMPLNEVRKKYMRARIREFGIESFKEMVQIASRSAFLKGDKGDYASLRKTAAGIEWKPQSSPDSDYQLLITLDELSFHFSDFTNEQIEQLQKPALDAAEEADKATRRLNDLSDHRDKIIDSYWWRWNEATDEWENTGEKARGDDGNVMFASFYIKDSKLYMNTPSGYEGPQFKLLKNKLYVILNA